MYVIAVWAAAIMSAFLIGLRSKRCSLVEISKLAGYGFAAIAGAIALNRISDGAAPLSSFLLLETFDRGVFLLGIGYEISMISIVLLARCCWRNRRVGKA